MLVKHSIGWAIVLFWCLMNVLLIKRQLWAPPSPITLHNAGAITEPIREWWGIFHRGEKIGHASQTIIPKATGYQVQDRSLLRLQLMGTAQKATTQLDMDVDSEWTLEKFNFLLQSNDVRFHARGRVTPGKLTLTVDSAGHVTTREVKLSQRPYLSAALKPYIATQQLEPGKEHYFSTFDPATLSQQVTTVVIEGREYVRIGEQVEPAMRIRQRFNGISVVSWIDGAGRTLKEETPAGFSLVRQTPLEAESIAATRSIPLDLVSQTSITPDRPIPTSEQTKLIKLRLSGIDLQSFPLINAGRQRLEQDLLEVRRESTSQLSSIRLPVKDRQLSPFTQSTPFMQSDHPKIRVLAREILGGETDGHVAVLRLKNWVYKEIGKEPTVSIPSALEVLRTRKGDCNEHTVLFNALARAAGIPAKTAVGVVYLRNAFYYHAWSEVWLSRWISLDSTFNQFPADATHIKFLEGEIDRQIDVLQLIGNLKISVVDAS
ncbi:MAG: transglutaminase-like domain-containing protein [Candidatus Binatia bacterium]